MPLKVEKVGIIGKPSDWLIASVPDSSVLRDLKNFNFIDIPIQELYDLYEEFLSQVDGSLLKSFGSENNNISSIELQKSEAFYVALKQVIKKYQLTAFTIRCFDLLIEYQSTGCFALSRLNDEGIIAGCEGDIVSLIGMIIAARKTGQKVWMANPSQIDIEKAELVLAHCTVPTFLVKEVTLNTHFESDQGIGLNGQFTEAEVTIFRLGGKRLTKKFISIGNIIPNEYDPNLCRTQIRVKMNDADILKELLAYPLGNHLLVLQGSHINVLDNFLNK